MKTILFICILAASSYQKITRTKVEIPNLTTKSRLGDIEITRLFDFSEADQNSLKIMTTEGEIAEAYEYIQNPTEMVKFPQAGFRDAISLKNQRGTAAGIPSVTITAWNKTSGTNTGNCLVISTTFLPDQSFSSSYEFGKTLTKTQCLDANFNQIDGSVTYLKDNGLIALSYLRFEYEITNTAYSKDLGVKTLQFKVGSKSYLSFYRRVSDKDGNYEGNNFYYGPIQNNINETMVQNNLIQKFSDETVQWVNLVENPDKITVPSLSGWIMHKNSEGTKMGFFDIKSQGTKQFDLDQGVEAAGVSENWNYYYEISLSGNKVVFCTLDSDIKNKYTEYASYKNNCQTSNIDFKAKASEFVDDVEISVKDSIKRMRIMIRDKENLTEDKREFFLSFTKNDFFLPKPRTGTYLSYSQDFIYMLNFHSGKAYDSTFFLIKRVMNIDPISALKAVEVKVTASDKDGAVDASFNVNFVKYFEQYSVEHTKGSETLMEVPESVYTHEYWNKPVVCKGDFINSPPKDTPQGYRVNLSPYYFKDDPNEFFTYVKNGKINTIDRFSCDIATNINLICENNKLKGYKMNDKPSDTQTSYLVDLTNLDIDCIFMKCSTDLNIALLFNKEVDDTSDTRAKVSIIKLESDGSKYKIRNLYPEEYIYKLLSKNVDGWEDKNGDIQLSKFDPLEVKTSDYNLKISFNQCYPFINNFNIPEQKNEKITLPISASDDSKKETSLQFSIKYKIDQNNFKVFVKSPLVIEPGQTKTYNLTDYFLWLGNGIVSDMSFQDKIGVKLIGYNYKDTSISTDKVQKLMTVQAPFDNDIDIPFGYIESYEKTKSDYITLPGIDQKTIKDRVKQFSFYKKKENLCVIGLFYKQYFNRDDVSKSFFTFSDINQNPMYYDLGDIERVEILDPVGNIDGPMKFLALEKNKTLALYDFTCRTAQVEKNFKRTEIMKDVVSFDYFSDYYGDDKIFVTIFAVNGDPYTKGGFNVFSFDYSDFTKKLNFEYKEALDDFLEEVSSMSYVRIRYNRQEKILDVVIDGNDFRFFNFQGGLRYDGSSTTFTIITPLKGSANYRKSFISQRFGCDITKDFIICGSFSRIYDVTGTKRVTGSNNNYMIFAKRNGKYSDPKSAGYSTTISHLASYDIRDSDASIAVKNYMDNTVYLNKFASPKLKTRYERGVSIVDLSSGFKLQIGAENKNSALKNIDVQFFGNYFSLDRTVLISGSEFIKGYSDIVNRNMNTFVMIIAGIAFVFLVIFSIKIFKENKKEDNQQTEQLRKALEEDDSAAMLRNTQEN